MKHKNYQDFWSLSEIQIRDPFVLLSEDTYYLFGSTDQDIWRDAPGVGFDCYESHDLQVWQGPFEAFRPPRDFWGTHNFWAPEVFSYRGSYYMFATFLGKTTAETGSTKSSSITHKRGTAILKAEHPRGPFLPWSNGAVTPPDWMCLDGTLYVDDFQQAWIVFCHEWVEIGDGTVCACKLSDDLKTSISPPMTLFASSESPFSKTVHSPSFGMTGYVTDGCFLHQTQDHQLLLLWSCMGDHGYCISYAKSETGLITGPWNQQQSPLFHENGGHGMIFTTLEGRKMLAIHTPNETPQERAVFFELLETQNGICLRPSSPKLIKIADKRTATKNF